MDQRNENARIDGIIQSGKFVWKGNVYTVDIAQTRKDNSNYVSADRPVKYLHGVSESGTPVKAWAHECSEVDDQPQDAPVFVEPIEPEVMNEQPVVIQEHADVTQPKQHHRSKKHKD